MARRTSRLAAATSKSTKAGRALPPGATTGPGVTWLPGSGGVVNHGGCRTQRLARKRLHGLGVMAPDPLRP